MLRGILTFDTSKKSPVSSKLFPQMVKLF